MIELYVITNFLFAKKIPLIPFFVEGIILLLFNSRIPSDVTISKKTKFAYKGMATLLAHGTMIGYDCLIGVRVTTGRRFPYKNVPKIGHRVWIGANSTLIGPIVVEDNVIISPNALMNKSVPKGAIIGGSPAKILGWVNDLDYDIFDNPKYKEGNANYI